MKLVANLMNNTMMLSKSKSKKSLDLKNLDIDIIIENNCTTSYSSGGDGGDDDDNATIMSSLSRTSSSSSAASWLISRDDSIRSIDTISSESSASSSADRSTDSVSSSKLKKFFSKRKTVITKDIKASKITANVEGEENSTKNDDNDTKSAANNTNTTNGKSKNIKERNSVRFDLSSNEYDDPNCVLTTRDIGKLWWTTPERDALRKKSKDYKLLRSKEAINQLKGLYESCVYGNCMSNITSGTCLMLDVAIKHCKSEARGFERDVLGLLRRDRSGLVQAVLRKQDHLVFKGGATMDINEFQESLRSVSFKMSKHHQQLAQLIARGDREVAMQG